jgi:hypothetical protein
MGKGARLLRTNRGRAKRLELPPLPAGGLTVPQPPAAPAGEPLPSVRIMSREQILPEFDARWPGRWTGRESTVAEVVEALPPEKAVKAQAPLLRTWTRQQVEVLKAGVRQADRSRRVAVLHPITVVGIDRRPVDPIDKYGPKAAIRVQVECEFRVFDREHPDGVIHKDSCPLQFYDGHYSDLLDRLLKLGTSEKDAKALTNIKNKRKQKPFVLSTGVLSELLLQGISPTPVWIFVLTHAQMRDRPSMRTVKKAALFRKAIDFGDKQCRVLKRLQPLGPILNSFDVNRMTGEATYQPQARKTIGDMIRLHELDQKTLEAGLANLGNPAVRKSNHQQPERARTKFCRDWYAWTKMETGIPLYAQGAQLYGLTFGRKVGAQSFRQKCIRARRQGVTTVKASPPCTVTPL